MEARYFRLTIAITLISLFVCGGYSSYLFWEGEQNREWIKTYELGISNESDNCLKQGKMLVPGACPLLEIYQQSSWDAFKRVEETKTQGKLFFILALVIPAISFAIFYVGRWIMSGKLKS